MSSTACARYRSSREIAYMSPTEFLARREFTYLQVVGDQPIAGSQAFATRAWNVYFTSAFSPTLPHGHRCRPIRSVQWAVGTSLLRICFRARRIRQHPGSHVPNRRRAKPGLAPSTCFSPRCGACRARPGHGIRLGPGTSPKPMECRAANRCLHWAFRPSHGPGAPRERRPCHRQQRLDRPLSQYSAAHSVHAKLTIFAQHPIATCACWG